MTAGATGPRETPNTLALIEREKVRLAYGTWVQYVDGRVFAVLLTLLMCGLVPALGRTAPVVGAAWLATDFAWSAGSSLLARFYFRHAEERSTTFWKVLLAAIWSVHGLVWGGALIIFWDASNPANQAVLCTIVVGVMVSYFFFLSPCFPVLLVALATLSATAWAKLVGGPGALSPVFEVVFPVFFIILVNYSREAARRYHEALRLRFEKEALAVDLMRANQAKNSFLASMSHDLRTPLNAVIGYADLIRQRTFGPIAPARYAGYIDDIHASGAHLLKMINDLLDLAKIEAGKREFAFAPVDLKSVAQEAMKLVEPQAERAMIALMLDIKHDAVVNADHRAVKQMITNLLSNAVKFSRTGGIAVLFCEILSDNRTLIGVKDTGIGMTPEMQRRAIEPFAQESDAYTVEGRGTGLGLPIVKGLIEAHQGQLKIESLPGAGSKVWLEFPPERLLKKAEAA
jgi:signal transduction histidine kinase